MEQIVALSHPLSWSMYASWSVKPREASWCDGKPEHHCGISRPLQGDRTQSLWPRQELSDSYHHPTSLVVVPPPPAWATWSTPFYPLLGMWPTPHPAPTGDLYTPNQSAGQQVYRKTSLLSLGYKNRHDHVLRVDSPWLPESHPAVPAASLISINSSFPSVHHAGKIMDRDYRKTSSDPPLGVWLIIYKARITLPVVSLFQGYCKDQMAPYMRKRSKLYKLYRTHSNTQEY